MEAHKANVASQDVSISTAPLNPALAVSASVMKRWSPAERLLKTWRTGAVRAFLP